MSKAAAEIGLWIHGISGRMGGELKKAAANQAGFKLIGGSSHFVELPSGEQEAASTALTPEHLYKYLSAAEVNLIVDFSGPTGNALLLAALSQATLKEKSVLLGSTGLSSDSLTAWKDLSIRSNLRLLIAPNTSIGILLALAAALRVAPTLVQNGFDIEISETHHRGKKDAPSGTARFLAEALAQRLNLKPNYDRSGAREAGEIGVHAIRGGGVTGEHVIRFIGDNEELCLSHRAFSRSLFATGALNLGRWLTTKPPGAYELQDVAVADFSFFPRLDS